MGAAGRESAVASDSCQEDIYNFFQINEVLRRHGAQRARLSPVMEVTGEPTTSQPPQEWRTPIPPPRRSIDNPETLGLGTQWRPSGAQALPQEGMNVWVLSMMKAITDNVAAINTTQVPPEELDLEFSGKPSEDPVAFFDGIVDWLVAHRMPRERYHRVLRRSLRGEAFNWFSEVQNQEWPLVRALFLQRYNSTGTISRLWSQLFGVTQKPGERVGPFIMAKWGLHKRLSPATPDGERLAIISELLNLRLKAYLRGKTFTSLQELIEVSFQVEGDIREMNRPAPTPLPRTTPNRPSSGPIVRQENRRPGQNRPPEPPRGRQPPNPCRWCGGNHYNAECPNRLPPHQPVTHNRERQAGPATPTPSPRQRTQEPRNQENETRAARAAPTRQA